MTEQTNDTAPAPAQQRALTPLQSISQTLDSEAFAPKIAAALDGTGISPERFKRAALAALSSPNAEYLVNNCDRGSIYTAVMNAAAAGIELHPSLGHGYLVPRGKQAVLQVGYKGLIALATRGQSLIGAVDVGVIRERDDYEIEEGTHPRLVVRRKAGADRGEIVAFYCITHYRSGVSVPTVMDRADVERIRDTYSDAFKRGGVGAKPWREEFEEQGKKTVLRRASKLWPISIPGGEDEGPVIEAAPVEMRDITPAAESPAPRGRASRLAAFAGE
ncbi:MAG: recombinase RecT [Amaricoccus sp.]